MSPEPLPPSCASYPVRVPLEPRRPASRVPRSTFRVIRVPPRTFHRRPSAFRPPSIVPSRLARVGGPAAYANSNSNLNPLFLYARAWLGWACLCPVSFSATAGGGPPYPCARTRAGGRYAFELSPLRKRERKEGEGKGLSGLSGSAGPLAAHPFVSLSAAARGRMKPALARTVLRYGGWFAGVRVALRSYVRSTSAAGHTLVAPWRPDSGGRRIERAAGREGRIWGRKTGPRLADGQSVRRHTGALARLR